MIDRKKTDNNHFWGGYISLCLHPYNSNFQCGEMKKVNKQCLLDTPPHSKIQKALSMHIQKPY